MGQHIEVNQSRYTSLTVSEMMTVVILGVRPL